MINSFTLVPPYCLYIVTWYYLVHCVVTRESCACLITSLQSLSPCLSHDSFRRLKLHKGNKTDQYKKKIAKLETDLRVLQEGGPLDRYSGYGSWRGRIEGSIRGMSL